MNTNQVNLPVALARLEYHSHGGVWVVEACPICGKPHRHGGGGSEDDPRNFLGRRTPACVPGDVPPDASFSDGYVLVEAPAGGFSASACEQGVSGPNSGVRKPPDSAPDTPTNSRATERACARQDDAQPDGPAGRDADCGPRRGPDGAKPGEETKTMSDLKLSEAAGKVTRLGMDDLKWVAKRLLGAIPKGKRPDLQAAIASELQREATGEGENTVVSDAAAEALAGVGGGKSAPKQPEAAATEPVSASDKVTLEQALAVVNGLATKKLALVHEQVVGKPGKGLKKPALFKAIAAALQKKADRKGASATLPDDAVSWLAEAKDAKQVGNGEAKAKKEPKPRDPRLPQVNEVIRRRWREQDLEVKCLEDGFEFAGKVWKSLSAISSHLLQTPSNGFLFWHLQPSQVEADKRRAEREADKAKKQAEKEQQPEPVKDKPSKSKKTTTKPKSAKGGKKAATQA